MPQPGPQAEAIRKHWVDEIFYGGAVGGGKSDYLLGDFAQDVPSEYGRYWHGILFRRTYPELEELIARSLETYPPWFPGARWSASRATWEWPNGATLKLRYLEHSTDWMRYWGHQYTWIGWDELPSWPDLTAYQKLKARLRSAHAIPNKRIRATGNPGGPSHHAVKVYFGIDRQPQGGSLLTDEASGMRRMFIRSRLHDNRILLRNDPRYADRLKGLGSPELVRAWLEGDWSVIQGAYFPEFSIDRHVIQPFDIPSHWLRFGAFDWGSAAPFSYGLYAVSDGSLLPDQRQYPAGALIRYREWYGAKEANVGLKLTVEDVAKGIRQREGQETIAYRVADPACFKFDGGPSIAERFSKAGVTFRPADNSRISGWDQVRQRLKGDDAPMLYVFATCTDLIRTLPALQHDEHKPEDVDTEGEDHAGDECRYACMSRPYVRKAPEKQETKFPIHRTFNQMRDAVGRRQKDPYG